MCVWNVSLREEKCYNIFGLDAESSGAIDASRPLPGTTGKRRVREWVTDAVCMSNCHRIAIASTGRDIRFFDTATSTQFYEEFCLYGRQKLINTIK
jgi:hypothetical protein